MGKLLSVPAMVGAYTREAVVSAGGSDESYMATGDTLRGLVRARQWPWLRLWRTLSSPVLATS